MRDYSREELCVLLANCCSENIEKPYNDIKVEPLDLLYLYWNNLKTQRCLSP